MVVSFKVYMTESSLEEDDMDTDLKDAARLEHTLQTRENIIHQLMADGELPDDKSDRAMLIAMLDGIDRTVLSKAKIKSDDTAAKSQQQTARMVANVLTRMASTPEISHANVLPVLPASITLNNTVPGELEIGHHETTYEEFLAL